MIVIAAIQAVSKTISAIGLHPTDARSLNEAFIPSGAIAVTKHQRVTSLDLASSRLSQLRANWNRMPPVSTEEIVIVVKFSRGSRRWPMVDRPAAGRRQRRWIKPNVLPRPGLEGTKSKASPRLTRE